LALSYGEERKITSRILRNPKNFHRRGAEKSLLEVLCAFAVRIN